jgi:hypothetical protein
LVYQAQGTALFSIFYTPKQESIQMMYRFEILSISKLTLRKETPDISILLTTLTGTSDFFYKKLLNKNFNYCICFFCIFEEEKRKNRSLNNLRSINPFKFQELLELSVITKS